MSLDRGGSYPGTHSTRRSKAGDSIAPPSARITSTCQTRRAPCGTCGTSTSVYDLATSERLLEIPDDDKQLVGPDGSIRGTRSEVQTPPDRTVTDTWTWDLKLEIAPPAGP